MKILVDTHTHTVASGHAYSTLKENAIYANSIGVEGFVCTDHGPAMRDGAQQYIINCLSFAPDNIEGVRLYCGTEANILDFNGKVDISQKFLSQTDFAIASFHDIVVEPSSKEEHTNAVIKTLENVYIDCIGHPGNPCYEIDLEAFVNKVKEKNKVCEINNHSFVFRKGSDKNCTRIIKLCMEKDVRIAVSSDAHLCYSIGSFPHAIAVLEEYGFPQELIVNTDLISFNKYIEERKQRIKSCNEKV